MANYYHSLACILYCLIFVGVRGQQCSLCSGGGIQIVNRTQTLFQGSSCGAIEDGLNALQQGNVCDLALEEINQDVLWTAFCCADEPFPDSGCLLCGEGAGPISNPDFVLEDAPGTTTCGQVDLIAQYSGNAATCLAVQASRFLCCDEIGEVSSTCSLCPGDGEVSLPSRVLPFNEGTTCEDVAWWLSTFSNEDECSALLQELNAEIDFASWCGCQGQMDSLLRVRVRSVVHFL